MAKLAEGLRRLRANDGTALDLRSNTIGDAGAAAVAEALKRNNTLTKLDLGSNTIGEAGAAAVAEARKRNNTLTTLNLGGNTRIGDAGFAALAQALQGNTALTTLDLECVSALRSPSLRLNHSGVLSLGAACSAPLCPSSLSPIPSALLCRCVLPASHVCMRVPLATSSGPDERRCAPLPMCLPHCSFYFLSCTLRPSVVSISLISLCPPDDPALNQPSSLNHASSAFAPNTTIYSLG